ncbi:MAG: thioredoxin family protein [Phycisphaerales bacterium]|nr:MAG: thioredoxin family protein [Phycisphaerales bacterium]UCF17341.1 MAG: thioredoxin family protein [Phycisphaerales bacterium]
MVGNRYVVALLAVFVTTGLLAAQRRPQQKEPVTRGETVLRWFDSYQAGMNAAQARKRPALVKFEAEWCGWCKKLDSEVFAQPQIIKALERYVCIRVDVDRQRNVALAYKIRSLPRIVIVNVHNEIVGDWLGFRDAQAFSKSLEEVWEYTLTKAETTPAPTVRPDPSAPGQPWQGVKIDPGDESSLIELLGHKSPAIRAGVINVLVKDGAKSLPVVVPALESKYLGTRIAAWKVFRKVKGSQFEFDPWAPGPERAQAVWKLKEQLGLSLPKAAPQSPTGT